LEDVPAGCLKQRGGEGASVAVCGVEGEVGWKLAGRGHSQERRLVEARGHRSFKIGDGEQRAQSARSTSNGGGGAAEAGGGVA
jgi:hypothetical protein